MRLQKTIILSIATLIFLFSVHLAWAEINWQDTLKNGVTGNKGEGLYATTFSDDTTVTLAKYIGGVLTILPFLGFMLIIRIIWAGYQWLTAGGNAEKVEEAKKTIMHAVIGVAILSCLYLFAYFILTNLKTVTYYKG